jgi:hypothetical protein
MYELTTISNVLSKAFKAVKIGTACLAGAGTVGLAIALAIPDSNENIVAAKAKEALYSPNSITDKPVFYFNTAAVKQNVAVLMQDSTERPILLAHNTNNDDNVRILQSSLWNFSNE